MTNKTETVPLDRNRLELIARTVIEQIKCDDVTILRFDKQGTKAVRVFSTLENSFPNTGSKPVPNEMWRQTVLVQSSALYTLGPAAITDTFPDAEQILELGFGAVLNFPLWFSSEVRYSANCLFKNPPEEETVRKRLQGLEYLSSFKTLKR